MRRWINTFVLYDAGGRVIRREGYWYDGSILAVSAMASFDQDSYAFYDDGTESASVIIGSADTQQSLLTDTTYLCRLNVSEVGGAGGNFNQINWQRDLNGGGFGAVSTSSTIIQAVDSANLTNDEDTTQRLGSGTFVTPNAGVTEDGTTAMVAYNTSEVCEFVLAFQIPAADVNDGDTILLRLQGADVFTLDASIDVDKPATRRVMVVS